MIRIIILSFISMLFFIGCKNETDNKLEQEIIKTLEQNNVMLDKSARSINFYFKEKMNKIEYAETARIWLQRVQSADSLLLSFSLLLDEQKKQAPITDKKIISLFIDYKNKILLIDPNSRKDLDEAFKDSFNFTAKYQTSNKELVCALFKNKATILRNYFVDWCQIQVSFTSFYYD